MANPSLDVNVFLKNVHLFTDVKPNQAEIVITRYNEPLDWTKDIAHLCTVYNKGPTPLPNYSFNKINNVPNRGLGIETILRHIILNYNSLATVTFFCQGRVLDRQDQPLYPLEWYLLNVATTDFKGVEDTLEDSPRFRITDKVSDNKNARTANELTFGSFRKDIVGVSYRQGFDKWVKGDWFSIGRDRIRAKPLAYYIGVYIRCEFQRGVVIEELWYLERSYHSMFNRPMDPFFKFTPPAQREKELLEYLNQNYHG